MSNGDSTITQVENVAEEIASVVAAIFPQAAAAITIINTVALLVALGIKIEPSVQAAIENVIAAWKAAPMTNEQLEALKASLKEPEQYT